MPSSRPLVVANFGGGLNSSAMIIEAHRKGETPDLILFADTGNEHPGTYLFLNAFNKWCEDSIGMTVTRVNNYARPDGTIHYYKTLEEECLGNETLPSIAYGNKGCSRKWKVQPMDRYLSHHYGDRPRVRWIGIDAGETKRSTPEGDDKERFRYPLIEWGINRGGCAEIIGRALLPMPHRSACWFCPSAKKREVLALAREHPDLFARAVEMERVSEPSNCRVSGLGRNYSWKRLVEANEAQRRLWPESESMDCVWCYDGDIGGGER